MQLLFLLTWYAHNSSVNQHIYYVKMIRCSMLPKENLNTKWQYCNVVQYWENWSISVTLLMHNFLGTIQVDVCRDYCDIHFLRNVLMFYTITIMMWYNMMCVVSKIGKIKCGDFFTLSNLIDLVNIHQQ